jgi:hypothetical protein
VVAHESTPESAASLARTWLERLPGGATVVPAFPLAKTVAFAGSADMILGYADGELHVVDPTSVRLSPERSVDGARKLSRVAWQPHPDTLLSDGEAAREQIRRAWNRAALGTSAQLLGLGETMLAMTVEYVSERKQFGVPVGSFQAVKHQLADARLALSFATPAVHRAAHTMAGGHPDAHRDVSMAKAMASEAAAQVGRAALQCHGAIGYTTECDLHLYLKRTWALASRFGDARWHRRRVAAALGLDPLT